MSKILSLRARGITLLETILALAIGAAVVVGSIQGLNRYTESVQIQASASQLQRLISAADTWTDDNYEEILTNAPRVYTPAETQTYLSRYLGGSFPQDAFKNSYRMVSRTYIYPVPDPANPGAFINRDAVQVLLVGFNANANSLTINDNIRVEFANTSGQGAGFISTGVATCGDGSGGTLPAGNICGAYGTYALPASLFTPAGLTNAVITGLVTKGDSSFYGDQLYRYDYGDPELNTMRTTLFMESSTNPNEIQSTRNQFAIRASTPSGGEASITVGRVGTGVGGIGQGDIILDPGNTGRVVVVGTGANNPSIRSNTGTLLLGDMVTKTMAGGSAGAATPLQMGDGDVRGNNMFASIVRAKEISNLWLRGDAPLRLQKFARGEVIIGNRAQYQAIGQRRQSGPAGSSVTSRVNYEVSDGRLIAGHVVSQDITCADCGGTLSEILPKWRHMGTYFIGYTSGAGSYVPYPACGQSRRNAVSRAATTGEGAEQAFVESPQDDRYRPSILLIPRQIRSKDNDRVSGPIIGGYNIPFNSHLRAIADNSNSRWRVLLHIDPGDNVYTTAFALTYCVFTGGNADPANAVVPDMFAATPTSHGTWVSRE